MTSPVLFAKAWFRAVATPLFSCQVQHDRTGFEDVELFCSHPMSSAEQRRTEWMIFESYQDYIDPQNPELTVEGYPAPHRVYLLARRTNKKGR